MQPVKYLPFSVLLSVYHQEDPLYFQMALSSIWDEQTLKPFEIIIVKDGLLTEALDQIIDQFSAKAPVKCVVIKQNSGLGIALAKGVEACSYNIIARMDTDDCSRPHRFEKQISFIMKHSEYDIIGSNIDEFEDQVTKIKAIRQVPEFSGQSLAYAKRRNPINHMSVVFRKQAVLRVGNYTTFKGYEDYYLWVKMLQAGSLIYNIQESLVAARVGEKMLKRRLGAKLFFQELKFQKILYQNGFTNKFEYSSNLILRALPRLMPVIVMKYIYKFLRKL